MRSHRFVTPRGLRRLRNVFPSAARAACSRVFFANGPEPFLMTRSEFRHAGRRTRAGHLLRKANNCERPVARVRRETAATAPEIPAGHGPAGDQQAAAVAVSPAVSLFAVQQVFGPPLSRRSIPDGIEAKAGHYVPEMLRSAADLL